MKRDKNVSPAEFKICQHESMLLQIKICHQFALVQISGGDSSLFVSPVSVWRALKLSL